MNNNENIIYLDENRARSLVSHKLMGGTVKKSELFDWVLDATGASLTPSTKDDMIIKSMIGSIVAQMEKDGLVMQKGSKLTPTPSLSKTSKITKGKTEFLRKIHSLGGAFFEEYMVRLLERYYTHLGCEVISAFRCGGSNDGGVDGVLKIKDQFGFVDTICIQCKNRNSDNTVTTKEVREFYGAMTAMGATRGIYATTSKFHIDADDFLHSIYNCVGVDGDSVYRIAQKTQYGLLGSGEKTTIDLSVIKPI